MNTPILCPTSNISGHNHYYTPGTGQTVTWDVMGDPRNETQVCPECAYYALTVAEDK